MVNKSHTYIHKLTLKEGKEDLVLIRLAKMKTFVRIVNRMQDQKVPQIIGDGIKCCKLVLGQFENNQQILNAFVWCFFVVFLFFLLFGLHPWHMELPRLATESKPQLLFMPQLWQHRIRNPVHYSKNSEVHHFFFKSSNYIGGNLVHYIPLNL